MQDRLNYRTKIILQTDKNKKRLKNQGVFAKIYIILIFSSKKDFYSDFVLKPLRNIGSRNCE